MLCKEETTNGEAALFGGVGTGGVDEDVDNEEGVGRTGCTELTVPPCLPKNGRSCCKNGEFDDMIVDIVKPF